MRDVKTCYILHSGTTAVINLEPEEEDETLKADRLDLSRRVGLGRAGSQEYLAEKWGCEPEYEPRHCWFGRPFNEDDKPIGYWVLDRRRRECLMNTHGWCFYNRTTELGVDAGEGIRITPSMVQGRATNYRSQ
jgi:hypothetical protein